MDEQLSKAKAIAARLSGVKEKIVLGKRQRTAIIADEKLFQKKIYIPVKNFPRINFVGLLIGPAGSNQKRMNELSGANIFIRGKGASKRGDPDEEEDLHALITGNEYQVQQAEYEIENIVYNPKRMRELKQVQLHTNKTAVNGEEEVQIPAEYSSFVIGRNGETINLIQERSGARIRMPLPHEEIECESLMRTMYVGGTEQEIDTAKRLIHDILSDRLPEMEFDEIMTRVFVPIEKIHVIASNSGETIRDIQARTYTHIEIPRDSHENTATQRVIHIRGPEIQQQLAKLEIEELIRKDTTEIAQTTMMTTNEVITITIPDSAVGVIVGKGGRVIRGITERTGAKIKIDTRGKCKNAEADRVVTITGATIKQRAAITEIETLVYQDTVKRALKEATGDSGRGGRGRGRGRGRGGRGRGRGRGRGGRGGNRGRSDNKRGGGRGGSMIKPNRTMISPIMAARTG